MLRALWRSAAPLSRHPAMKTFGPKLNRKLWVENPRNKCWQSESQPLFLYVIAPHAEPSLPQFTIAAPPQTQNGDEYWRWLKIDTPSRTTSVLKHQSLQHLLEGCFAL